MDLVGLRITNWQIGKFIGSYGYTAKGHQYQAAGGRPVFCFLGGPFSLFLVLPFFVLVGSVGIVSFVPADKDAPVRPAR